MSEGKLELEPGSVSNGIGEPEGEVQFATFAERVEAAIQRKMVDSGINLTYEKAKDAVYDGLFFYLTRNHIDQVTHKADLQKYLMEQEHDKAVIVDFFQGQTLKMPRAGIKFLRQRKTLSQVVQEAITYKTQSTTISSVGVQQETQQEVEVGLVNRSPSPKQIVEAGLVKYYLGANKLYLTKGCSGTGKAQLQALFTEKNYARGMIETQFSKPFLDSLKEAYPITHTILLAFIAEKHKLYLLRGQHSTEKSLTRFNNTLIDYYHNKISWGELPKDIQKLNKEMLPSLIQMLYPKFCPLPEFGFPEVTILGETISVATPETPTKTTPDGSPLVLQQPRDPAMPLVKLIRNLDPEPLHQVPAPPPIANSTVMPPKAPDPATEKGTTQALQSTSKPVLLPERTTPKVGFLPEVKTFYSYYVNNFHYEINKAGRFHLFAVKLNQFPDLGGYEDGEGDDLKSQILDKIHRKLANISTLEELETYRTELQASLEYKVLGTAQGLFTLLCHALPDFLLQCLPFLKVQTSSQEAADNMMLYQEHLLREAMTETPAP